MQSVELPYHDGPDGEPRPYLWLSLTGINGRSGNARGLIDSGADRTTLPWEYAPLMGYTASTLEAVSGQQVQGTIQAWIAREPSRASVVGIQGPAFDLWPMFIPGSLQALWGRGDFMSAFGVRFDESSKRYTIYVP